MPSPAAPRLLHHVREQTEKPSPLDCLRKLALLLGRDCRDPARHDLAPLRDEALQQLDILVVDLRRVRAGERARFPPTEERAPCSGAPRRTATRLTFHLCLHRFRHRPLGPVGSLGGAVTTFAVPFAVTGAAPLAIVPTAPALHDHRRSIVV